MMEACGAAKPYSSSVLGRSRSSRAVMYGGRRQPLELGEELLDADGLGGIDERLGELPGAVGALGPDFQLRPRAEPARW